MKCLAGLSLLLVGLTAPADDPPTITDPTTANPAALQGRVNQFYSLSLDATGGTPPYTWSASNLPPGLQISTTDGVISGVPILPGRWSGTRLFAADKYGNPTPFPLFLKDFQFGPYLFFTSSPQNVRPKQPFTLGSVGSFQPGAEITLTLADPWIGFESGSDTTCQKTTSQITLPATTDSEISLPFTACVFSAPRQASAYALIRATAAGYPAVAEGILLNFGTVTAPVAEARDLTAGAKNVLINAINNPLTSPPTATYFPDGTQWLVEADNCDGQTSCTVGLAPIASSSLFPIGEQVATRLNFKSKSGAIGSILATFRYLPSTASILSKNSFVGFYDWAFRDTASAAGGSPPYSWSAAGLPPGLNISPEGVISGTVLQAGTWQSFLTVTDGEGYRTSQLVSFSFKQGPRKVLVVVPSESTPNPLTSDPIGIGTVSSSPAGATVTLSIADADFKYFGFASPDGDTPPDSCPAAPYQSTAVHTRAPVKIYVCNKDQSNFPTDWALRTYVQITASAPGYSNVNVLLPLERTEVYYMQLASPLDISNSGTGTTTVSIVANQAGYFVSDHLSVPTLGTNSSWIRISPTDPGDPCFMRASCSFEISVDPTQLTNLAVGETYSGKVSFSTENGLLANLAVIYQYSGSRQLGVDVDDDEQSDVAVWRPSNGDWYIIPSSNSNDPGAAQVVQWGSIGDVPVAGDFDGDGITDYAVWRPLDGSWYIMPSTNPGAVRVVQWGSNGDVPVSGDFDGDGITDYAVWRPSDGSWYITPSANPDAVRVVQWGSNGDVPIAGDFDGDGITDCAVWRPSDGSWYITPSANPGAVRVVQWGLKGDVPVAGDFDGDGITDYAVWRPSDGSWYVMPSTNPGAVGAVQWGSAGDVPVSGDFDGDGITDYAVWRPSDGSWYIIPSANPGAVRVVQWGLAGDVPPAAVVLPPQP